MTGVTRAMPRILGLGDNTIDTYVSAGLQFPGGNAVNVAALARRLGAQASYLGCWGDDEGGAILRAALTAEGVDLSHVREIAGGETARAHRAREWRPSFRRLAAGRARALCAGLRGSALHGRA